MSEDDNVMKILVATDNHIGYMEKDPVRGNDSLETFEEILRAAKDQEVDFILLGGDLFHENKPSRQVLHKTMELLRHYCMGSRPCPVEFRSDQSVNFQHSKFPVVNYEDPNYNVSIPVFSIHGNHDDPAGEGNLSAMDVLSVSNLVNYFGKAADIEHIEVSPLLLQKGKAKLALYGLGSCRDERLHRVFRKGNVRFLRPSEEEGEWFSMLVLHQNRAKHGATNHIPASFLPEFLDLVIWGHEHECLIEPEWVPCGEDLEGEEKGVFISQPGSSIATSLTDGELAKKHIATLFIKDCTFKMESTPLKSVRPFVMDNVCLAKTRILTHDEDQVTAYLTEKVKNLIDRASAEADDGVTTKLPLVRLKVDYSGGYNTFSLARFGQKFVDQVANPRNILNWYRRRDPTTLAKKEEGVGDRISSADLQTLDSSNVSALLVEQLKAEKLSILSEKNLAEALAEFVDKEEKEAISDFVKYSLQQTQEFLRQRLVSETDIDQQIVRQREELCKRQETAAEEVRAHLRESRLSQPDRTNEFDESDQSDRDERGSRDGDEAGRGKGRGRGRGGRGRRGRGSSSKGGGAGGGQGRGKETSTRTRKATAPVTPAASSLSFLSSGAATSSKAKTTTPASKRRSPKRAVIYEDESESDGEVQFLPSKTSKSKTRGNSRAAKSSSTGDDAFVDLTQSDKSEGDSDGHDSNPFSRLGAPASKRRKH